MNLLFVAILAIIGSVFAKEAGYLDESTVRYVIVPAVGILLFTGAIKAAFERS